MQASEALALQRAAELQTQNQTLEQALRDKAMDMARSSSQDKGTSEIRSDLAAAKARLRTLRNRTARAKASRSFSTSSTVSGAAPPLPDATIALLAKIEEAHAAQRAGAKDIHLDLAGLIEAIRRTMSSNTLIRNSTARTLSRAAQAFATATSSSALSLAPPDPGAQSVASSILTESRSLRAELSSTLTSLTDSLRTILTDPGPRIAPPATTPHPPRMTLVPPTPDQHVAPFFPTLYGQHSHSRHHQ